MALAEHCPDMTSLDLGGCVEVGARGVGALAQLRNLIILDLSCCPKVRR